MNPVERYYKIHQLLVTQEKISLKKMVEVMQVSRSTIMRDINAMRTYLGAPILWMPSPNEGYYYDPKSDLFELPGFWFNASELYALLASDRLLQSVSHGGLFTPYLEPVRRRIQDILQRNGMDPVRLARYFLIRSHGRTRTDLLSFQKIAQALQERRLLKITYLARSSNRQSSRRVDPQRLIHHRENWYLVAYCRQKQGLRTFSVDAVTSAFVEDEPCREMEEATLEQFLAQGFGIFMGTSDQEAVLCFSAERSRWVRDELWHPQQQGQTLEDGRYLLKLPFGDPTELIMEILRHGSHVQVLQPDSLRQRVIEQLQASLAHYEKK
ncbi:MAG: YafY family transcriptional regulator [Magnetococcales bacterium]|nr:YafY family transcriptional regulator [Magnetococcales bacterium]